MRGTTQSDLMPDEETPLDPKTDSSGRHIPRFMVGGYHLMDTVPLSTLVDIYY